MDDTERERSEIDVDFLYEKDDMYIGNDDDGSTVTLSLSHFWRFRHGSPINIRLGINPDGTLPAHDSDSDCDGQDFFGFDIVEWKTDNFHPRRLPHFDMIFFFLFLLRRYDTTVGGHYNAALKH